MRCVPRAGDDGGRSDQADEAISWASSGKLGMAPHQKPLQQQYGDAAHGNYAWECRYLRWPPGRLSTGKELSVVASGLVGYGGSGSWKKGGGS